MIIFGNIIRRLERKTERWLSQNIFHYFSFSDVLVSRFDLIELGTELGI